METIWRTTIGHPPLPKADGMATAIELTQFQRIIGMDDGQLPDVIIQGGHRDDWAPLADAIESLGWIAPGIREIVEEPEDFRSIPVDPLPDFRIIFRDFDGPAWDFDLRELTTQDAVDALCRLAVAAGSKLGKPILFVPEGLQPNSAVLRYEPRDAAFYYRAGTLDDLKTEGLTVDGKPDPLVWNRITSG